MLARVSRHGAVAASIAHTLGGFSSILAVSKLTGQSAFAWEEFHVCLRRFYRLHHLVHVPALRWESCCPAVLLLCTCTTYDEGGRNAIGDMDSASLLSARVVIPGAVRSDAQLS